MGVASEFFRVLLTDWRASRAQRQTVRLIDTLHPGHATVADAYGRMGEPYGDYQSWVVRGGVDVLVGPLDAEGIGELSAQAREAGQELESVRVLEWRNPKRYDQCTRLVFLEDTLWYTVAPPDPGWEELRDAHRHLGEPEEVTRVRRRVGGQVIDLEIQMYPHTGYAIVLRSDVQEEVASLVRFPL